LWKTKGILTKKICERRNGDQQNDDWKWQRWFLSLSGLWEKKHGADPRTRWMRTEYFGYIHEQNDWWEQGKYQRDSKSGQNDQ